MDNRYAGAYKPFHRGGLKMDVERSNPSQLRPAKEDVIHVMKMKPSTHIISKVGIAMKMFALRCQYGVGQSE